MRIHVAKKLTINSSSSFQECKSFDKYPSQLAEVNKDGCIELIGFGYDAVHLSLVQGNVQTD
ncbi:hypothetical protein [Chlorogloea sp. CCALA 695]|uniref:hypothetical protein n=1 Tax=Chlorogloea sp. CCALA 695 TaxID=2107693 RepID=UPI000D05C493|nr:hypothetical protein [Chlorogloea sp. CCALA 695]PSB28590.1 hypothetical protein C7B70_20675 [Chlorogloea sp. CCALA 695]